jgi:glucose/arabinose dehydrogenase
VCLIALLQACGGGGGSQPGTTPPPATDTTPPTIPGDVTATATSSTRIDLRWTASTDSGGSNLAGYRLYRDGSTTALATINAPATTYSDTGLTAHTQYSYVLRAFDGAGNESAASSAASTTTLEPSTPGTSGLDARPSNTSCRAWPKPASGTIRLERFTNLSFDSAIAMLQAPTDNGNWYVVEQGGTIQRFSGATPSSASPYGTVTVTSGGEMGLLGMAFHPGFPATDSRVFLSYTLRVGGQLVSRVSSFANSTATALGPTETVLLTVNQPEDNHNGGNIAFGPDGYLYIGLGDGGGGGDNHGSIGNGQRLTTLLGKMLRIDVDAGTPYGIPSSNPFATQPLCPAAGRSSGECPEIYAWGLRNPWRWSFDRETGGLWVGDVGQGAWEEINRVNLGGNYGWRCREGAHDYNNSGSTCSSVTLIDPVTEYPHGNGDLSITGGYVYRGTQSTALRGHYLFADYGSGIIRSWNPQDAPRSRDPATLLDTSLNIPSFAEGNDGELYVVAFDTLHHIVFQPLVGGGTVPSSLRATGCVSSSDPRQPAPGLIPYDINAAFWSDGLDK